MLNSLTGFIILLFLLLLFFCRVGVFFFLVMNMIFGNLSAVELFIKERPIFMYVFFFLSLSKEFLLYDFQVVSLIFTFTLFCQGILTYLPVPPFVFVGKRVSNKFTHIQI